MRRSITPGRGVRRGCKIGIITSFDDETFDFIRARAVRNGTSIAEQIRLLVEWGLESGASPSTKSALNK